jgi:probable F420-dependent oxidoreductase
VAQRDPVTTAKAVATLDLLSGGRFVFGVGFGWNEDEMESHGVDPRTRRARGREHVLAMQRLWADDVASFTGEHVRLAPSWSWPKPVQRPWPPVFLGGGAGPKLFAHVAEYADGWMPIGGAGVGSALPALHEAVRAAGRDPAKIQVVIFGAVPDEGKMARYAALGVSEVVMRISSAGRDLVLPELDRLARWIEAPRGA